MNTVYQVRNWDALFENSRSRERDQCHFVCIPNKQDGMGLQRLLSMPHGTAVYGIFHLILGICSQQKRPRAGWLTDTGLAPDGHHPGTTLAPDGQQAGTPWAASDMALRWRRSEAEIAEALQILSSPNIGWLNCLQIDCQPSARPLPAECPTTARPLPAVCPPGAQERNENGTEANGTEANGTGTNERAREESTAGVLTPSLVLARSSGIRFQEKKEPEGNGEAKVAIEIHAKGYDPISESDDLEDLCQTILGKDEMARCGAQWRRKAAENPDRLRRVLLDMKTAEKEKGRIHNRGAYANDLWKRFA